MGCGAGTVGSSRSKGGCTGAGAGDHAGGPDGAGGWRDGHDEGPQGQPLHQAERKPVSLPGSGTGTGRSESQDCCIRKVLPLRSLVRPDIKTTKKEHPNQPDLARFNKHQACIFSSKQGCQTMGYTLLTGTDPAVMSKKLLLLVHSGFMLACRGLIAGGAYAATSGVSSGGASNSGSASFLAYTPNSTLAITGASTTPHSVSGSVAGPLALTPVRRMDLPQQGISFGLQAATPPLPFVWCLLCVPCLLSTMLFMCTTALQSSWLASARHSLQLLQHTVS